MRPLAHPVINDVPLESILHALSDPVRVEIFADIEKQHSPRELLHLLDCRRQADSKVYVVPSLQGAA